MATFTYTARAFNGDLRTATIDASSRDDVIAQLRKQRLSVVKIDQDASKRIGKGSIKTRDVVIFTRQFSPSRPTTRRSQKSPRKWCSTSSRVTRSRTRSPSTRARLPTFT